MAAIKATRPRPATLAKRREILDAAVDIFGTKGFANGTLQDIAAQVGMTHAGILHHFGSKNALLLEVLAHRDHTDVANLDGQHIPDGAALFRHLISTATHNARRAGLVQAYAVLSGESVTEGNPGHDYFVDRYQQLRGEITQAFTRMCEEAGIDTPETIAHGAVSILGVMDGLQIQWLLTPDDVDLAASTQWAIESIVSAVLHPQPSQL